MPRTFFSAAKNLLQFFDERLDFLQFIQNLLALEAGQLLQAHVQDRLRLQVAELELLHQACLCFGHVLRCADELDDLVDMIERFFQAEQDVLARLGCVEVELRPAADDFYPMNDEFFEDRLERERLRHAVNQSDHVHMESVLELGMLVKIIQDLFRICALLQVDDDADILV